MNKDKLIGLIEYAVYRSFTKGYELCLDNYDVSQYDVACDKYDQAYDELIAYIETH